MIKLFAGLMFLITVSSFAGTGFVDHPSHEIDEVGVCRQTAIDKLIKFANDNGASDIDLSLFRLVDNDKRILNTSHYSWYELDIEISGEIRTIRTLVQKSRIPGKCI